MNTQLFSQSGHYDWAVLWVIICMMHLTVCYYLVTYAFQSESILYICLNVKEVLAQNRCDIWHLGGLALSGHTKPDVWPSKLSFLGHHHYAKNLRHLFPPEILMIKESCNVIVWEIILVNCNSMYHVKDKTFLFFLQLN